mmetsp:Transcript_104586/g.207683  ORF Transcript_104586/g.207683 Transcript_104586/m.207683 type:complete len:195 (+) Transcript_104586:73-657(+)
MHRGLAPNSAMVQMNDPADGVATPMADDCLGLCGGIEAAFCETQRPLKEANWSYIGRGKGKYTAIPQYSHVGDGAGNFLPVKTTSYHGWRFRKCFLVALGVLLLLACFYCLLLWLNVIPRWPWKSNLPSATAAPTSLLTSNSLSWTTSLPFDCNLDFVDCHKCLLDRWSVSKRIWCCSHAQRGCDLPHSTASEV